MTRWNAGLIAGFVATVVLSALMLMKSAMGLMPQLDVIRILSGMLGIGAVGAWGVHFFIGTVMWGLLFAALQPYIPGGRDWVRGMIFGAAAWLLMMVLLMPMAGAGLFGMAIGIMAPIMTLVLHLIFGAVMGATYHALARPSVAAHA